MWVEQKDSSGAVSVGVRFGFTKVQNSTQQHRQNIDFLYLDIDINEIKLK